MKNIRKFETTAEMESAVLEKVSVNYNVETGGVMTLPSVIQSMKNYFRFVAVEDSNISLNGVDMQTMEPVCDINLQYNKNGDGWVDWDFTSIHLNAGETLYLRGNNENGFSNLDLYNGTGRLYMFTDLTGMGNGSTDGVYECHGDIMSLVYGDDFANHNTIPNDGCFAYMFALCDGLLTSPELTAEVLTDTCYAFMFTNCVNLKEITMLAGEIPSEMCLYNWVGDMDGNSSGVNYIGTFYKNHACELPIASDENGYSGIPEGWTVVEVSKLNECVSLAIVADDVYYGNETTTTVHYTAIGNHRDESGNITMSGIIVTGVTESDPFPQNLSTTETVQRVVTFTYMGCTAKTVVTHGVFVPYEEQYLTFKTLSQGKFAYENDISYSLDDGNTWEALSAYEETPLIPSGKRVLWKREYVDGSTGACFMSTGNFKVSGNIMSLSYGDNFKGQTSLEGKEDSYHFLFNNCVKLIDASELCLPATTLAKNCYYHMFSYCTNLTTTPELPATTLAEGCYGGMFEYCNSLTTAPELPAITLADWCYHGMFWGCSNMTTVPELPAITLAEGCYSAMFKNLKKLTTAPELPATTLANDCYGNMFEGCTSLTTAPELPATTLSNECYQSMFADCTSLTTAPELPATILAEVCYNGMFNGCTSLTTAPVLPATTLAKSCYRGMFKKCSSLTIAPELPATTLADNCYDTMFSGCTSLTTTPELPATTLANYCYWEMFLNCTSLTTAPSILPATTLTKSCYDNMFRYCHKLTAAPALPAETLVDKCYREMFAGCWVLNNITMLAKDISADECLEEWVDGVSKNGTFVKHYDMDSLPSGISGIPEGWVVNSVQEQAKFLRLQADNVNWYNTQTKIKYVLDVDLVSNNTTIKTISYTGEVLSDPFSQNMSDTETVTHSVSLTISGITSSTNFTQGFVTKESTPITFEALEYGTFSFNKKGNGDDIQYSKNNGTTWTTLASGETVSVVAGDKVMWKSTITPSSNGIGTFASSNKFNVSGNIMSLLYGDNFAEVTSLKGKDNSFYALFSGCVNLITAPELPATTLAYECYRQIFYGCTSLTTAPELPATTLADTCYMEMFEGCTSLTTAPELPSTTLTHACYWCMFKDCTSLTTAPELPATTLADTCYAAMFEGCKNLKAAPELPATTLVNDCYFSMFRDCNSLTTAPELISTNLAQYCYCQMFSGCTSLTTAPELPATELTHCCYKSMFYGCTSLTTAPELPATLLSSCCYEQMFNKCNNLIYIKMLGTNVLPNYHLDQWVFGVSSTGTFVKHPDMTSLPTGTSGIPKGWTVEDAVL